MMAQTPRSAATRINILKAAQRLLETRSMRHIQLKDVARQANVSAALILFHFKSKDELFLEAHLSNWRDEGLPRFDAWLAARPDLNLRGLALELFQRDLGNLRGTRDLMSLSWWWASADEDTFQLCINAGSKHLLRTIIREWGLPQETQPSPATLALHRVLIALYMETLRTACVRGWQAERATESYISTATALGESLRA
jgi:AcrR family transcriptional regulator